MPELPEVETVRRGLQPCMAGRTITRATIDDPRLVQPFTPDDVSARLQGATVTAVERRGKYLLIELDSGDVALHHLRMTGSFRSQGPLQSDLTALPAAPAATHARMRYELDDGAVVTYHDPRRFGTLLVADRAVVDEYLGQRLGPEPLGSVFTGKYLYDQVHHRTTSIKAALLNQRIVAGLGNIYVDEACFLAGVHPATSCDRLSRAACARLVLHARARLREAIEYGGSTLRDHRGVAGESGTMQERFHVYGRAGEQCTTCGGVLEALRVAGRGTTVCPSCQPRRGR